MLHLLLYINQTELTVYQNRHQKFNQLTLDQFFYQVLIQSTFNEKKKYNSNDDNDDNPVQDGLASTSQVVKLNLTKINVTAVLLLLILLQYMKITELFFF